MKKVLSTIIAVAIVLALVAGCASGNTTTTTTASAATTATSSTSAEPSTSTASAKDTVTMATSQEPFVFLANGAKASNSSDFPVLYNIYDTLVYMGADGSITPDLATSWTVSDDGLVYTFKLKQGVKFHDGSEMTADDVVFTYDLSAKNGYGKSLLINYDHSVAVDKYTVEVHLSAPFAAFLNGCSSRAGMIISKAYYEKVGEDGYLKNPIGTGAYKFISDVPGDTITLQAFDDYWNGTAAIKTVKIKTMTDASTETIALQNGDVDVIYSPTVASCLNLKKDAGVTWAKGSSTNRVTLHINTNAGYPGEDTNFRKAIQAVINKDDIIKGAAEGYGTKLDIDMCDSYTGRPDGYEVVTQDITKAKQYLAASNYKNEEFQLLVPSGTGMEAVAQIVQGQLMNIGINCTVNAVDTANFVNLWYAGKFGGMIRSSNSSLNDADAFLNWYMLPPYTATNNNQHPRNKEIYNLCIQARAAQGDARKALYLQAANIASQEAYDIPLYSPVNTMAWNTKLTGIKVHLQNVILFHDLSRVS